MARGWESKSVEGQQEAAEERKRNKQPVLSPEQSARLSRLRDLELSLRRVEEELRTAQNPRRREQLTSAKTFLQEQRKQAGGPADGSGE